MSEEILSAAGLADRIAALEAERDQQTARAQILAAQVAGWAAQCAAQVQAAQAYLDALADIPHNGRALGARVRLAHTIDSDASRALLTELATLKEALRLGAEADAALVADLARCHIALRSIASAHGIAEMWRLAAEALGEERDAEKSG